MPTKIKTWEIKGRKKVEKIDTSLVEEGEREKRLNEWIVEEPEIIHEDLEILGSEVPIYGKSIDILGFLPDGSFVVAELKRGESPRKTIAQAIDYASRVAELDKSRIREVLGVDIEKKLKENLEKRDMEMSDLKEEPMIMIVASEIDEATRSMIDYLSEMYEVPINGVVFSYLKLSDGCEVISRTAVVSEEELEERVSITLQELENIAKKKGIFDMIDIFRESPHFLEEAFDAKTWGKCIRFWTKGKEKIPFGIKLDESNKGSVEVWIRHKTVADLEERYETQSILNELKSDFHVKYNTETRTDITLEDISEAEKLVNWLEEKVIS